MNSKPSPTQNLGMCKSRKRCLPSLGHVTSSTNTSPAKRDIHVVIVETDHEPLKSEFKNEIHKSPKYLQSIQLAEQKHNLGVQYKEGAPIDTADTLRRAYTDGAQMEFCEIRALETVDDEEHIPVEPLKPYVFREQIAADADIQELIHVIKLIRVDRVAGSNFP